MFGKTKRRIVFTVVFSLLALLAVTLATIYLSNRFTMRRENEAMLKTYVERYVPAGRPGRPDSSQSGFQPDGSQSGFQPDGSQSGFQPDGSQPGGQPGGSREPHGGRGPFDDESRFSLSTFYSVAYSETGDVIAVNNGNRAMQSDETLLETASRILEKGKKSGRTGSVTYLVEERDGTTLVAMIDGTLGEANLRTLLAEMLIIGAAAMAVLLVISVFIARRIVKPLEENDMRQKRFISDAGHELKTPIAVVSANSELLRREIGENEWLSNIDYENEKMSGLVKDLLVLSRAESAEIPKDKVDLSKLTGGEVLPFEALAFEKGKRIGSKVEDGIFVDGNAGQLRQLVSILLDNALDHGTGEAVSLELRRERHSAVLEVSNGAEKISEEQISHLFDRFYRTDGSRNAEGSHYGLGLSIAKAVAEAHGGQIGAAYKDGRAVFTVRIPVKKTKN